MKNVAACVWKVFRIGMFWNIFVWVALVQGELASAQGELPCVGMCSGGAFLVHCFGGFDLCVPMAWSPYCLPCEESVRVLLSSDLVFVLCLAFDHLLSLFLFLCCFFFLFHIVTVCVVNALIKGEIEDQCGRSLVMSD